MKAIFFAAAALWAFAGSGIAHEEPKGNAISVTGTVVDTGCYMSHNAKGAAHGACAAMCAKLGVPLAIVDDSGKLYLPVAADHKNQNVRLMPFIEKRVKVTGTAVDKGGVSGIALKTVEAAR